MNTVTEVSRTNLRDIGGRILAFKRLLFILKTKQDAGGNLTEEDLATFKMQVSQLVQEDMATLMGVIESLVDEGEEMLTLLHEIAAADKNDFEDVQIKCLVFLAKINFEEDSQD